MTKIIRTPRLLGLAGLGLSTLVGCLPEDDLSDLEITAPSPSVSLPLLNTNLAVTDIITVDEGEGLLTENDDHTYSVLYQSQVQTQPVGEFFPKIPEQSYRQSFSLGINSPAFQLKSPPQKFEGTIKLNMAGLNIFALESKQGFLDLTLTSDYQHTVEVQVVFSNIIHQADSTPFVWGPVTIERWSNGIVTQQEALSDYIIQLVDGKVSYELEVTVDGSGQPISEDDELTLDIDMTDIEFAYLAGNFTGIPLPIEADTLNIPVLANAVAGTVSLNPTLRMDFVNSYGVQLSSDFSQMYVEQKNNKKVKLEDRDNQTFFGGAYEFPYMSHRNELPATRSQVVDRATSNIKEAFAELPRSLQYGLAFALNSAPEDTSFITDQSRVDVDVEIELPLEGSFDIVLQDSIPIDFSDLEDVEEMKILIKTENSFPLDAHLEIYFLDENERLITDGNEAISLFDKEDGSGESRFLTAAKLTDSNTGTTQPAVVDLPLTATLDREKFEQVRQATQLLVRTDLKSVNQEGDNLIKLYSFYNVRFSLATQIKTSLN